MLHGRDVNFHYQIEREREKKNKMQEIHLPVKANLNIDMQSLWD
jgi:hypothetical protein